MRSTLAFGVAALLATALPLAAAGQSPTPSTDDLTMTMEKKQKRSIVLPKPSPAQVRADADRAVSEYAATQDPRRIVKQTSPVRPSTRPDFDYDVKSGIQSKGINPSLKGR
jgi:hypothetical protein